jgi:hypothetical protein
VYLGVSSPQSCSQGANQCYGHLMAGLARNPLPSSLLAAVSSLTLIGLQASDHSWQMLAENFSPWPEVSLHRAAGFPQAQTNEEQ